jgi:hypothetical protein
VVLALVAGVLLFEIVRTAGSRVFAEHNPDWALGLQPNNPQALMEHIQLRLAADATPESIVAVSGLARRLIVAAPYESRGYQLLALAADAEGNTEAARRAMRVAADLSWRNEATSLWMINDGVVTGDFAMAFDHADAMLRRELEQRRELNLAIAMLAGESDAARDDLADHLSREPPWRGGFFYDAVNTPEVASVVLPLMLAVKERGGNITTAELEYLLQRQVAVGAFDQAYLSSVLLAPSSSSTATGFVTDDEFDGASVARPFNWTLGDQQGATVAMESGALNVRYDGLLEILIARQLTSLTSGQYRLKFAARGSGEVDRLTWRVDCADRAQRLTAIALQEPSADWRSVDMNFSVPANCGAQWLSLVAEGAQVRRLAEVSFDRVSIERLQ